MSTKLTILGIMLGTSAVAATLRPSVIVHGHLRDAYGLRLESGEQVSVFKGTNEAARTYTAPAPDGMSYHLDLDVYDPVTATAEQVQPGDTVQVKVKIGAAYQTTLGTNAFVTPGDGTPVRRDLIVGADADGDGLPDAWEQMVIANSGGAATNLTQVGPGHDTDGDGMTDDQEFWYGSFAFLPGDQLAVSQFQSDTGRYRFRFLTVSGVAYTVVQSPRSGGAAWTPSPVALSPYAALAVGDFAGTGDFMDVYVGIPPDTNLFYRLQAK